ncbi:HipA family kinase [Parapedobacter sp. DT-150]|uniref:HipA family kinase n=1 Tax=Parapedobacter sp. DT-150 TaxID=3396162 RepID=UPI003F19484F
MLPSRVSVSSISRAIETGGSRPVVVMADDFEEYLCKYDSNSKLINEYCALCFLGAWGIPHLPGAFVKILPEHINPEIISNRTQPHHFNKPIFGLRYQNEVIDVSNLMVGLKGNYRELGKYQSRTIFLKIALFDLWLANTDRSVNNYNLLVQPKSDRFEIVPIDHTEIFDGCRLGQQIAQLTPEDSILYADLAHVLLYNPKKIAKEANTILDNFPTFVSNCGGMLSTIIAAMPVAWCADKKQLEYQIRSAVIESKTWLADTKANFRELVAALTKGA